MRRGLHEIRAGTLLFLMNDKMVAAGMSGMRCR